MSTQITPCDPHLTAAETPRLSRQCADILAALREGRKTNKQLATLALKYTSRLSDCRAAGFDIRVVSRDNRTGVVVYELVEAERDHA